MTDLQGRSKAGGGGGAAAAAAAANCDSQLRFRH